MSRSDAAESSDRGSSDSASDDEVIGQSLGGRGNDSVNLMSLIKDKQDRKNLSNLTEWEKEKEVARRFNAALAKKQRDELLSTVASGDVAPSGSSREPKDRSRVPDKKENAARGQKPLSRKKSESESDFGESSASNVDNGRSGEESADSGSYRSSAPSSDSEFEGEEEEVEDEEEETPKRQSAARKQSSEPTKSVDKFGAFRRQKHDRDVQLFAECGGEDALRDLPGISSKRTEKAISELSLERLESVRLSGKRLMFMLEHPKAETYVTGAFVKLPKNQTSAPRYSQTEASTPQSNSQFYAAKIVSLQQKDSPFPQLTVVGLPSLDAPVTCFANDVVSEPFTIAELDQYKAYLSKSSVPHIDILSKTLMKKATQLASFTFTDEDVEAVLTQKRKVADSTRLSEGQTASSSFVSIKDVINRKASLEIDIQRLKGELLDQTLKAVARQRKTLQLNEFEYELRTVQKSLSEIKSKTSTIKTPPKSRKLSDTSFKASAFSKTQHTRSDITSRFYTSNWKTTRNNLTSEENNVECPHQSCLDKLSRNEQLAVLREIIGIHRQMDIYQTVIGSDYSKLDSRGFYFPIHTPSAENEVKVATTVAPPAGPKGGTYTLSEYLREVQQKAQRLED